ncbi:MAG: uroporphyrinogen-III C-methyltransferase [Sheuella sp.]|nr:uroporphyrinogen-III C-methyltransferase [Sheuella sp.]
MTENQNPPIVITDLPVKSRSRQAGPSWSVTLSIVLLLVVVLLGAGAWFQQKRFTTTGKEVATQLQTFTAALAQVQRESKQALALAESHASRVAQLELSLRESQNQFAALESAWETFNKGMEDTMLANDIERMLTLASQQLRLAGNVNNAIAALETALSTLIRSDRSAFAGLQRAINNDLERLRAQPLIDVPVISGRLDTLMSLVARAPLLVPDAAAPRVAAIVAAPVAAPTANASANNAANASANTPSNASSTPPLSPATPSSGQTVNVSPALNPALSISQLEWWSQLWARSVDSLREGSKSVAAALARELSGVVSIQRVSDANALLMSPEQGAQLRANLRTRLLTAQMALLMHQPSIWRSELAAVESSLLDRFDPKSVDTIAATRLVRELAAVPVSLSLPDIVDSIAALEAVRLSESTSNKNGN